MIITPVFGNLLGQSQALALARATEQVAQYDAAVKADYLQTFADWAVSVTAGRATNSNPPKPPIAFVVAFFPDPTTGPGSIGAYGEQVIKWPYVAQGTIPVCDMPPIPADLGVVQHTAGVALIMDETAAPGWFGMGQGDATKDGTIVPGTSKDGKSGLFRCVRYPFGGWYLKVA